MRHSAPESTRTRPLSRKPWLHTSRRAIPPPPLLRRKREEDIIASKAEIAAHEKAIKPQADAAAQKRIETIAQLESEKKAYDASLPSKIAKWEQELGKGGTPWTPLKPSELKSTNGALLTVEADQAVIATGNNGQTDYLLSAPTDLSGITAIRLEVLADDRLPGKGPGRQAGNFVLGEFELEIAPAQDPKNFQRVKFSTAKASFSQQNYEVAKAIDSKPGGPNAGWAISPQVGKNQTALFGIGQPIGHSGGSILRFTLKQPFDNVHTLGSSGSRLRPSQARFPSAFRKTSSSHSHSARRSETTNKPGKLQNISEIAMPA